MCPFYATETGLRLTQTGRFSLLGRYKGPLSCKNSEDQESDTF